MTNVPVSKIGWSILYVDSEQTFTDMSGLTGLAVNAIDNNPSTIWHTDYDYNSGTPITIHPHEIQINMGQSHNISGFKYLPRQDGGKNGTIGMYEFYVTDNPPNWGNPISGAWSSSDFISMTEKEVLFTPRMGQYLRLIARNEINGKGYTTAAEISAIEDLAIVPDLTTNFTIQEV